MRRSRWGTGSCGCGCWLLFGVAPVSYLPTYLYYHLEGSQSPSLVYPNLFFSRPRSCSRSDPHPGVLAHSRTTCSRSHPRPCPCFRNRFLLLVPGSSFSCRYHIVGQTPSLSPEATGYLRVPPSACGVDAASGIMAAPSLLPIRFCFQQQTVL